MPRLSLRPAARRPHAALIGLLLLSYGSGCGPNHVSPRLLLLISVDTLRSDRLGAYGATRELTPSLDALAGRSLVFDSAWAPTALTLPSMSAMLTGRHPVHTGVTDNASVLGADVPTLAGALSAEGWRCGAVVSNFVLRRASGLAAGFQRYDDRFPELEGSGRLPERTAADTTDALLRMADECMAEEDWRCFLWVHYQDPHGPYTPPQGARPADLHAQRQAPDGRRLLPESEDGHGGIPSYQLLGDAREVGVYRAAYDAEVRHVDAEIGRLLRGLETRGVLADAGVVFAADHGEAMGEDGFWFSHGASLHPALVRVPLLISGPRIVPGRRPEPVALEDLFFTLLAWARGAPVQGGRDLVGEPERPSRVYLDNGRSGAEGRSAWVEGAWVYEQRAGAASRWLHQGSEILVTSVPAERAREMKSALEAFRRELAGPRERNPQALGEDERERLRALGYAP